MKYIVYNPTTKIKSSESEFLEDAIADFNELGGFQKGWLVLGEESYYKLAFDYHIVFNTPVELDFELNKVDAKPSTQDQYSIQNRLVSALSRWDKYESIMPFDSSVGLTVIDPNEKESGTLRLEKFDLSPDNGFCTGVYLSLKPWN